MSVQKGNSKADTLVKVVLVFFISLLSFSVGTFVGQQVTKSDQRRVALEGEYKTERTVAATEETAPLTEADKISDKEVESLTEEFVNKEKATREPAESVEPEQASEEHADAATKPQADGYKSYPRSKGAEPTSEQVKTEEPAPEKTTTAAHAPATTHAPASTEPPATKTWTKHEKKQDGVKAAADKVAHNQAPTDGKAESRKPNSTLPAVASSAVGKYTVQVGSYPDETEAKTAAANLKGKGWSAFYVPANVQGRTWYRVSVGIYDTTKNANEARTKFMKETSTKSALVQKIVQ